VRTRTCDARGAMHSSRPAPDVTGCACGSGHRTPESAAHSIWDPPLWTGLRLCLWSILCLMSSATLHCANSAHTWPPRAGPHSHGPCLNNQPPHVRLACAAEEGARRCGPGAARGRWGESRRTSKCAALAGTRHPFTLPTGARRDLAAMSAPYRVAAAASPAAPPSHPPAPVACRAGVGQARSCLVGASF
jgi:hypothetical protein